ncbi:MAG: ABC transporter ATP-binding protein [Candidatus Cloacimonadaceae bacterium]|nr:ABC transporter ATP-binding protein [Candidatus Cloacimonadaceae bacterium]
MIRIENISYAYTEQEVLSSLNLHLNEDDFAVILGPNGAGKSTLLYAIMGFLPKLQGQVFIHDKPISSYSRMDLARLFAYVPQETHFQFDYTVEDIVLMGRYPWLKLMQSWGAEDRHRVRQILESLYLTDLKDRYFSQLSGGEKQRVLIARALAQDTKWIFLDETLSQLDINHQIEIMQMLTDIHTHAGIGILLVSHNLNLAANYTQRMIYLKEGKILASGTPDNMMRTELLQELFGLELQVVTNPLSGRMNILYPGSLKSRV